MSRDDRRRRTLGVATSAALPRLWSLLAERGWSQADLASVADVDDGNMARLLYGDRKASRVIAVRLMALGVAIALWDEPMPEGWTLPHAPDDDEVIAPPSPARTG